MQRIFIDYVASHGIGHGPDYKLFSLLKVVDIYSRSTQNDVIAKKRTMDMVVRSVRRAATYIAMPGRALKSKSGS